VSSCVTCRWSIASRPTWRHVAAELDKAAAGAVTADVSVALRMALMLEKVECRPA
jgi:hypothetical protein